MPKQKYYYAVVDKKSSQIIIGVDEKLHIFRTKRKASFYQNVIYDAIVPIPADSLHKLIKEHTKKAK